MNKICIDNSVLNKIKIESPKEMETSFFKETYDKAEIQLIDIIKLQSSARKENRSMQYSCCNNYESNIDSDISNNIIAFIGERGSGKSSAMLSFKGKMIRNGVNVNEEISNVKFRAIDNIDPSIMNKNDSIIEIIVGQMFKNYKDTCKNIHSLYERHLISCFEKVFSDLRLINNAYKYPEVGDDLENLISTSSAISLHNNFRELVDCYLKYIDEKESEKNSYLLISIDDLDLNLSSAQLILEQIGKFLIQDNVIILMAIKLEQLEEVLIQKNVSDLRIYEENYICKLDNKEIKDKFLNDIRNKSTKCLEKFLPYNKRIILPKVNLNDVEVVFKDKFINLEEYRKETESKSLKETIINIYFKKYRYIIESYSHLKEIMPSNLRGWIELFDFLNKKDTKVKVFDESKKKDESKVNNEDYFKNIQNLKKYYISHVNKEIESILIKNNLLEFLNCPIEELNKKVFVFINDYIMKNIKMVENGEKNQDESIIEDVIELNSRKRFILKDNVSLGYLITWIKFYENYMNSSGEIKTIEIIKLILSIRYLEIYLCNRNSGKHNMADIIGRDFAGRYFELVRNKHVGKNRGKIFNRFCSDTERIGSKSSMDYILFDKDTIDKMNIDKQLFIEENNGYVLRGGKLERKLLEIDKCNKRELKDINKIEYLLNMYFDIFEPQFQDQWKTRNSILYRNEFSLNSSWTSKYRLKKYWFKPLNIIGNQYLKYDEFDDTQELTNSEYIKPILFVININYFMGILKKFNTNINSKRPPNKPVEFLKEVINTLNFSIKEKLESLSKVIDINNNKKLLDLMNIKLSIDKKINKNDIEKFLLINITYNKYDYIVGYNLDYDDQGEYFLYYNWDKLQDIKIIIKLLDYSDDNYISRFKCEINNILEQIKIIRERIKSRKSQIARKKINAKLKEKTKLPDSLEKTIKEVENILNKTSINELDQLFSIMVCKEIEKICVEIEKLNNLVED